MKHFLKLMACLTIGAFCSMAISCGDDQDSPGSSEEMNKTILGKWQKYARLEADGSLSGGDPDEFWIFNTDGSFENEDGGEVTAIGTYKVDGNTLTIMSRETDGDRNEENFTGTFKIEGKYMDYTFTEIGDNEFTTYRFLKQ